MHRGTSGNITHNIIRSAFSLVFKNFNTSQSLKFKPELLVLILYNLKKYKSKNWCQILGKSKIETIAMHVYNGSSRF